MKKGERRPDGALWPHLGIHWSDLKIGDRATYIGTYGGVKANVSRANRRYRPARYEWDRTKTEGKYLIYRVR